MKFRKVWDKLVTNYRLTFLIISGTTFIIFLVFTKEVESLPFDYYTLLISAAMSILIGYQYALKKYLLSGIHPLFEKLSPRFLNSQYQTFSQNLKKKLHKSWTYRLTIIAVVMPFVVLELIKIWKWKILEESTPPFFYTNDHTLWSLLFDIINNIYEYSILFLLAEIIWIIIELTLIINELKGKYSIKIDVFDTDEIGGLKPLRSFVLLIVSSYFIIITLTAVSYMPPTVEIIVRTSPKAIITFEAIILSLMTSIGVILFITTQETIRELINKGVKLELERINRKYREIYDKVIEVSSNKRNSDNEKELEELRIVLDILEKEEIKIKQIKDKIFDIKTITTFITAILFPIITTIKKIIELTGFTINLNDWSPFVFKIFYLNSTFFMEPIFNPTFGSRCSQHT